jgi:hypothetical protein
VRRHAKASTAGSTSTDAPSRPRRGIVVLVASLVLVAVVALAATAALGAEATEYVKSFGPDGTESSDFVLINGVAVDQQTDDVYVLDAEAGTLSKFEADGTPLAWGGSAPYISGNVISGLDLFTGTAVNQLAVDSSSHVIYLTEKHSVRAFHVDGEAAEFTAGPGAGTDAIPSSGNFNGVAVDASGALYASDGVGTVSVFAPTGEPLTSFSTSQPNNLGVAPDGTVYVVLGGEVHSFIPDEFPVRPARARGRGGCDQDRLGPRRDQGNCRRSARRPLDQGRIEDARSQEGPDRQQQEPLWRDQPSQRELRRPQRQGSLGQAGAGARLRG